MRTAALVQQRRDIPEPCPPLRFPALRVIEPASEVVNDQRRRCSLKANNIGSSRALKA
jgi:hypothetical protein